MVSCLCSDAGILGFKTNHSLRVTSATRLFHSGADEQLIMSHTGHRSVDGVRTYKWESQEQKRSLSNVLNAASNGQPVQVATKKPKLDLVEWTVDQPLQHSACKYTHCYCHCGQLQLYRLLFHRYQLCKVNYHSSTFLTQILYRSLYQYSFALLSYCSMIPYCSSISEYFHCAAGYVYVEN